MGDYGNSSSEWAIFSNTSSKPLNNNKSGLGSIDHVEFGRNVGLAKRIWGLAKSLKECMKSFPQTEKLGVTVPGMCFIHPL